jgi:hypothetical protein
LGELTGKPADSSMHIHPISNKSFQYVLGEHFSSYLEMSKEEFLLRNYPLLFSLDISALETCLGSNNSRSLPEEVIANSPLTNRCNKDDEIR